jgi:transglutaminase-like putative cysteine protease
VKIKKAALIASILIITAASLFLQGCCIRTGFDFLTRDSNSNTGNFPDSVTSQETGSLKETAMEDTSATVTGSDGPEDTTDTSDNSGTQTGQETGQSNGRSANIAISYYFEIKGSTNRIEFITVIPDNYNLRQDVKEIRFSTEPSEIYTSNYTKYAKFLFNEQANDFTLDLNIDMEIFDYDLQAAIVSSAKTDALPLSSQDYIKYTSGEKNIDTGDPSIVSAAEKFNETDQLKLARQIYDFVLESLYYQGYNPGDCGAAGALAKSGGDCTEYADLFVTLCRVKGIPARVVEGYTADAAPSEMPMGHNWSEAYIEGIGWVPYDCIFDDNNGESAETTFYNLKDVYIYNSFVRNDPELLGYHYFAYYYYGDEISVEKSVTINP